MMLLALCAQVQQACVGCADVQGLKCKRYAWPSAHVQARKWAGENLPLSEQISDASACINGAAACMQHEKIMHQRSWHADSEQSVQSQLYAVHAMFMFHASHSTLNASSSLLTDLPWKAYLGADGWRGRDDSVALAACLQRLPRWYAAAQALRTG